jgi:hypothetical protein
VPAPSSEDEGGVVEYAEAGRATSTAQPPESSGGALAPAGVWKARERGLHLGSRTVRAGARVVNHVVAEVGETHLLRSRSG